MKISINGKNPYLFNYCKSNAQALPAVLLHGRVYESLNIYICGGIKWDDILSSFHAYEMPWDYREYVHILSRI